MILGAIAYKLKLSMRKYLICTCIKTCLMNDNLLVANILPENTMYITLAKINASLCTILMKTTD